MMSRTPARATQTEYPPFTRKDIPWAVEAAAMAGLHMRGEITNRGSIVLTLISERNDRRFGTVYFLRVHDFVKIGFTQDLSSRMNTLKTGSPYPLELAWVEEGSDLRERYYHALFNSYRAEGEWFKIKGRLATFLKRRQT